MDSNFFNNFFTDIFQSCPSHSFSESDMVLNKSKYEEELNGMFGDLSMLEDYAEMVQELKDKGWKVLRNSKGEHRITKNRC